MTGKTVGKFPVRAIRLQAVSHHDVAGLNTNLYPAASRHSYSAADVGRTCAISSCDLAFEWQRECRDGNAHSALYTGQTKGSNSYPAEQLDPPAANLGPCANQPQHALLARQAKIGRTAIPWKPRERAVQRHHRRCTRNRRSEENSRTGSKDSDSSFLLTKRVLLHFNAGVPVGRFDADVDGTRRARCLDQRHEGAHARLQRQRQHPRIGIQTNRRFAEIERDGCTRQAELFIEAVPRYARPSHSAT